MLDRIGEHPSAAVLDFAGVPFIDSTGAVTLEAFVRRLEKGGTRVVFASVADNVRRSLASHRLGGERVRFVADVAAALNQAET